MLEYIITSKAKRSLLKLLLTNPDREYYLREIARRTGEPVNAIRRELGYLEKAGLVRSRTAGNLKYYAVVKESPIYPELKKMIYTTIGFGDYLSEKLRDFESIETAFIYGSVARDEETNKSDIDVFVVGEIDEGELFRVTSDISRNLGRTVNYTLMSREEFVERIRNGNPFVQRVIGEKKFMLKGDNDFNRFVA